jgi:diketogulonate reductase-like aldo/keto reductase
MCINLEVDWQIGDALQELFKEGIVTRGDLWITSKLWSVLIQPSLLS